MKILIAILLIVHGLIVSSQSSGSFTPVGGVRNPGWLNWWPANLGQSWLLSGLGVEQSPVARAGGFLWLVAGGGTDRCGTWHSGVHCPFHLVADSCPGRRSCFARNASHLPASLLRHWHWRQYRSPGSPGMGTVAAAGTAWVIGTKQ